MRVAGGARRFLRRASACAYVRSGGVRSFARRRRRIFRRRSRARPIGGGRRNIARQVGDEDSRGLFQKATREFVRHLLQNPRSRLRPVDRGDTRARLFRGFGLRRGARAGFGDARGARRFFKVGQARVRVSRKSDFRRLLPRERRGFRFHEPFRDYGVQGAFRAFPVFRGGAQKIRNRGRAREIRRIQERGRNFYGGENVRLPKVAPRRRARIRVGRVRAADCPIAETSGGAPRKNRARIRGFSRLRRRKAGACGRAFVRGRTGGFSLPEAR